jgi:hypothetical protein
VSPGRVRVEDLPPEVARKVAGRTGQARKVRGSTQARDRSPRFDDSEPGNYRAHCSSCGEVFTSEAAANRHCRSHIGHRRTVWDGLG